MPRYVVVAPGVGVYGDVVLPGEYADAPQRAARAADDLVGAPALTYRTVALQDPSAEYVVYRVADDFPLGGSPHPTYTVILAAVACDRRSDESPRPL